MYSQTIKKNFVYIHPSAIVDEDTIIGKYLKLGIGFIYAKVQK